LGIVSRVEPLFVQDSPGELRVFPMVPDRPLDAGAQTRILCFCRIIIYCGLSYLHLLGLLAVAVAGQGRE